MKAQIIPLGEETCYLIIVRDGQIDDYSDVQKYALLLDELEAVRDAIEEYLEKVSQEEMK
jgi:hypothetical protein